eukprot:tig00021489_g21682.t1
MFFSAPCAPAARLPAHAALGSSDAAQACSARPSFLGAALEARRASDSARPSTSRPRRELREYEFRCEAVSTPEQAGRVARVPTPPPSPTPAPSPKPLFSMRHKFENSHSVKASAEDVVAILTSPATMGLGPYAYHPHITGARSIPDEGEGRFDVQKYIGGFAGAVLPRGTYGARVQPLSTCAGFEVEAWAGSVRINAQMRWIEDPDSGTVRLVETGFVEGSPAVAGVMSTVASGAHGEMVKRVGDAAAYRRLLVSDGNGVPMKELIRIVNARTV